MKPASPTWLRHLLRLRGVPPAWLLRMGGTHVVWPILFLIASVYRRTALRRTPIVAIVGSFGKTTTRAAVLGALGIPRKRLGGNSKSSLAVAVLRHRPGQPLVIEVAIDGKGQMRPYGRMLRPTIVVVTTIGGEHRLSLGDLDTTQREKGEMVAAIAAGGLVVANGDDPRVRAMAMARPAHARGVFVGWGADNEVRGEDPVLDWPKGTKFTLVGPGFRLPSSVGLVGRHSLRAAFAATAVALELDHEPAAIAESLRRVQPVNARMQPVELPSGAVVLRDDFKSALETIESAFEAFTAVPARRRLVVLGDVTEPEGRQHVVYRELGRRAGGFAARILACGSNHRDVVSGAHAAGLPRDAVTRHRSVHEMAALLAADLGPGDVVLLKGRTEQRLGRIALLLSGVDVRCRLTTCYARGLACERCPRLLHSR